VQYTSPTLPNSDTCLGTLTLLAPKAGDFVEFILRYAVLFYQYKCGDVSVNPYYALATDETHCIDKVEVDLIFYRADIGIRNLITF